MIIKLFGLGCRPRADREVEGVAVRVAEGRDRAVGGLAYAAVVDAELGQARPPGLELGPAGTVEADVVESGHGRVKPARVAALVTGDAEGLAAGQKVNAPVEVAVAPYGRLRPAG